MIERNVNLENRNVWGEALIIELFDDEYSVPVPKASGGYDVYFTDDEADAVATLEAAWAAAGFDNIQYDIRYFD